MASKTDILDWLERFSAAVRDQDFGAGRALFANDVAAFGTRADVVVGLDQLVEQQWRHIWASTRNFRFDLTGMQYGGDGETAWVAVPWYSQGMNTQGRWVDRSGRATYILQKRGHRWLAVHTHHSRCPSASPEHLMPPQPAGRVG